MTYHALRRTSVRTALALTLAAGAAQAQWSSETLTEARTHASVVAADGKVYFAGGDDLVSTQPIVITYSDRIEIYDSSVGPPSDPAAWSMESLSSPRTHIASTAVGDYVLFAGGALSFSSSTSVVDVLETTTMTWSQATLSENKTDCAAVTLGDRAFFAAGNQAGLAGLIPSSVVDIYDASVGPPSAPGAWSTALLSEARTGPAAVAVGGKVLIAGGATSGGPAVSDVVDIYDSSIGPPSNPGAWSTAQLSQARLLGSEGSAVVGAKAYFAGGTLPGGVPSDVIDVYDADADTWETLTLSVARQGLAAVAVGDTVLFAGGSGPSGVTDLVEVLDATTDSWGPSARLSEARQALGGAHLGDRAFFGGGFGAGVVSSDLVDVFADLAWTNLGGGTPGIDGQPFLAGEGSLVGGTPASISLTYARPDAQMLAWIALGPSPFAALGGTVHAFPFTTQLLFTASGSGSFAGATSWPVGVPPGTEVWFQFFVADNSSIHGITLSNGVKATTP